MRTVIGLIISGTVLLAQGNSEAGLLRSLSNRVLQHRALVQNASAADVAAIRAQAAPDIRQREAALARLIESDPEEALRDAFSSELLDHLRTDFPDSAAHFEKRVVLQGILESLVADDWTLKTAKTIHRLKTSSGILNLYFPHPEPKLKSGMAVSVTGVQALGAVAAEGDVAYDLTGGPVGMSCGVTGAQHVLTILATLPDSSLAPTVNADLMNGILYGNQYTSNQSATDWSLDDFWQQNSDGQTSAPYAGGRVVGPYQLSSNFNRDANGAAVCDYQSLLQAAMNAADNEVRLQDFNRVVIVFPYNGSCGWAGLSSVGCWTNSAPRAGSFTASASWLRADQLTNRATGVELVAHELGHGLGLHHASTRDFSLPAPRVAVGPLNTQGTTDEYGDIFSAMGYWSMGFYAAPHAQEILGWLNSSSYQTVTTSGVFSVRAYETRAASGMVKALKILRDAAANSWLWLEYRTNGGNYNSQLNSQVWSGALIHYVDSFTNIHSNLLDFTPSTSTFSDPALAVGQTWVDSYTNLSITVNSIVGDTLTVTVTYGPPPCVHASPVVSLSPSNPSVNPSSSVVYTVSVTNADTAACSPASFSLSSAQPSGFTGTLSPTLLTVAPGARGTATLTVKAGTTVGMYPISVAGRSASDSNYAATASANITVTSACMPANPTVTISPAAPYVLPSGSVALTVTVKNNNSPLCSKPTFTITTVQPSGLTGTLGSTSVSIASGASANVTLTEKASTVTGTFPISVTATNSAAKTYLGTGTSSVTVAPCILSSPAVTISPGSASANFTTAAKFTVTVRNQNSPSCAAAKFTLAATAITGLTASLSATSLTLASGATETVTLTETTATTSGTFSPTVRATNSSATIYTSTASTSLEVVRTTVTATTNSSSYIPLSSVTATVSVAGATPISAATVTFTLKKPNGTSTTYKTTTNSSGVAVWTYKLASTDLNGSYTVSAAATVSNKVYSSNSVAFSVSP